MFSSLGSASEALFDRGFQNKREFRLAHTLGTCDISSSFFGAKGEEGPLLDGNFAVRVDIAGNRKYFFDASLNATSGDVTVKGSARCDQFVPGLAARVSMNTAPGVRPLVGLSFLAKSIGIDAEATPFNAGKINATTTHTVPVLGERLAVGVEGSVDRIERHCSCEEECKCGMMKRFHDSMVGSYRVAAELGGPKSYIVSAHHAVPAKGLISSCLNIVRPIFMANGTHITTGVRILRTCEKPIVAAAEGEKAPEPQSRLSMLLGVQAQRGGHLAKAKLDLSGNLSVAFVQRVLERVTIGVTAACNLRALKPPCVRAAEPPKDAVLGEGVPATPSCFASLWPNLGFTITME